LEEERVVDKCGMSLGKSTIVGEVRAIIWSNLTSGGWGHQRLEEERRREEQDRLRSQMQFDTYASSAGGLGMAGADVPRGEGPESRIKRGRSEEEDERRTNQRLGDRDEE
jgi:nuclear cap-binding protein subunit 2